MAEHSPVTGPFVLEFFDNLIELKDVNKVKGNCKTCQKEIKGQKGVTSNFVSHLKVIALLN